MGKRSRFSGATGTAARLIALAAVFLSALPVAGGAPPIGHAMAAGKPNIVLIVTDDLDAATLAKLPNVRRLLAEAGTTFPNFFLTTPTCCPSRASILRGQYAHNHGILRNEGEDGGFATFVRLRREASAVSAWLQRAGYRTGLFGKYLNGYPHGAAATHVPPDWDAWFAASRTGFFDYQLVENGTPVDYGADPGDYLTDVLARQASRFIAESAAAGSPFFALVTPRAPHSPATPAPRHVGAFAGARAPRGAGFDEADVSDKPAWVQAMPRLSARAMAAIDAEYRLRRESLLAVDEMVAGLIDTLRRAGVLDRTYVLFTSDNGFHLGEHRLASRKGTPYDEVVRVPLLVRGPGVPVGRINPSLVANIDLAPTFADLAGAVTPPFVDGRSLVPLFSGAGGDRQAVLIEDFGGETAPARFAGPGTGAAKAVPPFRALRSADLLYVEYATGERELYDRRVDPDELVNLAARADRATIAALSERVEALFACAADTCRALEDRPLPAIGPLRDVPPGATAGSIVSASADLGLDARQPTADPSATVLAIDGGEAPASALLRFELETGDAPISRAALQLWVLDAPDAGSVDGPNVYRAPTGWTETGGQLPGSREPVGIRLDKAGPVEPGRWLTFDVSRAVDEDGVVELLIRTRSRDGILIASRESSRPPRVVVDTLPVAGFEPVTARPNPPREASGDRGTKRADRERGETRPRGERRSPASLPARTEGSAEQ